MGLELSIRGERQWAAAVKRAAKVESLEINGPLDLSLEGIEQMTSLRTLELWEGAPTDQLYRLADLSGLEWVMVQLGEGPHDLDSLNRCRIEALDVTAFDIRRGLELAAVSFAGVRDMAQLSLQVKAPAMVPWDCEWLSEARGLEKLSLAGLYVEGSPGAVLSAGAGLREVVWHEAEDEDIDRWRERLQALLPDVAIRWWHFRLGYPELHHWDREQVEVDGGVRLRGVIRPADHAALRVVPSDGGELLALLARWLPALERRATITSRSEGIWLEVPYGSDLTAVQELLTLGTPDMSDDAPSSVEPDDLGDPVVSAFVRAFLDEVAEGRLVSDDAAAARWAAGVRELEAAGIEELDDTEMRERLYEILRGPLERAGLDAEHILLI